MKTPEYRQSPGRNFNTSTPEYEALVLTTRPHILCYGKDFKIVALKAVCFKVRDIQTKFHASGTLAQTGMCITV
jgi:hypothetical protein